jgi:membrane protease YdiL (CAAX protease family)
MTDIKVSQDNSCDGSAKAKITSKHSQAIEILIANFFIFFFGYIVSIIVPSKLFLNYYVFTAIQCAVIYGLNLKYPLKMFSLANPLRACKYGLFVGIIIIGFKFAGYINGSLGVPFDYISFVKYSVLEKYLFTINLILVAPIVEEILFRGFFYRILRDRYSIIWGGSISISLFAIGHQFDVSIVLLGFICTYIYQKSESIWGSIIAHSMNNLGILLFGYFKI